jgi:hypothetical protein
MPLKDFSDVWEHQKGRCSDFPATSLLQKRERRTELIAPKAGRLGRDDRSKRIYIKQSLIEFA